MVSYQRPLNKATLCGSGRKGREFLLVRNFSLSGYTKREQNGKNDTNSSGLGGARKQSTWWYFWLVCDCHVTAIMDERRRTPPILSRMVEWSDYTKRKRNWTERKKIWCTVSRAYSRIRSVSRQCSRLHWFKSIACTRNSFLSVPSQCRFHILDS